MDTVIHPDIIADDEPIQDRSDADATWTPARRTRVFALARAGGQPEIALRWARQDFARFLYETGLVNEWGAHAPTVYEDSLTAASEPKLTGLEPLGVDEGAR